MNEVPPWTVLLIAAGGIMFWFCVLLWFAIEVVCLFAGVKSPLDFPSEDEE